MDKTGRRIAIKVNRDGLEEPYSRMSNEARLKFAAFHNSCVGLDAALQELATFVKTLRIGRRYA